MTNLDITTYSKFMFSNIIWSAENYTNISIPCPNIFNAFGFSDTN